MDEAECVVIGAGVIGLACARALALAGRDVIVLEAADRFGTGISARNSEVIHAGIYYPQGSLKARLCVSGRRELYAYCAARGIAHKRCGKLIVATNAAQVPQFEAIAAGAARNGVDDLRMLSADEAKRLEPALACVTALESPSTGIVDAHGLMLALLGDAQARGASVAYGARVNRMRAENEGVSLWIADGAQPALRARLVVNAAGLGAAPLTRRVDGLAPAFARLSHYAKGNYFSLSGRAPFSRLVYPAPVPGGLGVHLTLDLGGQARFGPDVEWVDAPDYDVNPERANGFYAAIREYWPGLPDHALHPAYAGVRPKLGGPDAPPTDFIIEGPERHGAPGLINLLGIESPGLTSSLAIGAYVADMAEACL
ncbi:MAG: NAD(P)/FAD-dependent oxidoreductase [Hyphomonadaceae bacterium]|nr:NAD(P)/FAD-dependent oxidoreductase [Hyphomonadaceae bacterium]